MKVLRCQGHDGYEKCGGLEKRGEMFVGLRYDIILDMSV